MDNGGFGPGDLGWLRSALQVQVANKQLFISIADILDTFQSTSPVRAASIRERIRVSDGTQTPEEIVKGTVCFVSAQGIKVLCRNEILQQYLQQKSSCSNQRHLQQKLLGVYCKQLVDQAQTFSLRTQILQTTDSLKALLKRFPSTRDYHFLVGTEGQVGRS